MGKITVFGIPNCNTVKKSMDWLKNHSVDFQFHNFKKEGVTKELLKKWSDVFGWEKTVNKKGLTFKKLDKEAQVLINSPEAAIAYLMENTSAIKRPIVEIDNKPVLLGFVEEDYKNSFS